ncbi:MAG: 3-phosphoshikimate 1-carboxyvinyltransferase [Lentisphaeria bacterium]
MPIIKKAQLLPAQLSGKIAAIVSKSVAHRQLICAGLNRHALSIRMSEKLSIDINTTLHCLCALGGTTEYKKNTWQISPILLKQKNAAPLLLNCGESGTTLRLLLPVVCALGFSAKFVGHGRLPERPLGELCHVLREHGIQISSDSLPLACAGQLKNGAFVIPGNISSQYISGLLFALPLLKGESTLTLSSPLQSASYVKLTLDEMRQFGIVVEELPSGGWRIPGNQQYCAPKQELSGEGDWSNAAVFLAAGAFCQPITMTGLNLNSIQGDRAILGVLRQFGAGVLEQKNAVTISPGKLTGCDVDVSEIPDLLPVLAVLATAAEGVTNLKNAGRLRLKESDRLASVCQLITALGGSCKEFPESLQITGTALRGGDADSCNDHRIVMAAALAALRCKHKVILNGAESIRKSYPDFWQDYKKLGGKIDVV